MSKIVFFCIPAHGHTNPTLNVVRELVARGHEVWYYSYDLLREKIEAAGAKFISCDAYDCEQKLTPEEGARIGSDVVLSARVLVDSTLALDGPVCRHMEELKPDCIVGDSMACWAKAVAAKLNIPFVSSTTTFAFNRHAAQTMDQSPKQLLSMLFSLPRANREVKRLRSRGYPFRSILDIIQNDNSVDTVVYTSREFQPCADTFSDKYEFVGPSIRPAGEDFPKTGKKLVYVSMGTVKNDMLPLYRSCIEGLKSLDAQIVLSVGEAVDRSALGPLPHNVEVYPRVDQIAVLEKADAFLSHCGMNSASESLYFGVPVAALPQTPEQTAVANRIVRFGAGIRLDTSTPDSIAQAVKTLLEDPSYRENAEKVGKTFRNCPGARGAADKILSVCRK